MNSLMFLCVFFLCLGLVGGAKLHYAFWRRITNGSIPRKVVGGTLASLENFPTAVSLLDRTYEIRCTGSVISEYWAVTSAHCAMLDLGYVGYNTIKSVGDLGNVTIIIYVHAHPQYRMYMQEVVEDKGKSSSIAILQHDIGLVRTREQMILDYPNKVKNLLKVNIPAAKDLMGKEITVLGFAINGDTSSKSDLEGEDLYATKLRVHKCPTEEWLNCLCGRGRGGKRDVCAGDSGGPVFYGDIQVGIAAMGPVECATTTGHLQDDAASVFTSVSQYVPYVKDVIQRVEKELQAPAKFKKKRGGNAVCYMSTPSIVFFLTTIAILSNK